MRLSAGRAIVLGIALALMLVAGIVAAGLRRDRPAPGAYAGTPVDPPKTASDFVLIDGKGKPAHLLDARKPIEFLFFGYTHCPDECPLAMASLGRAYRSLTPSQRAGVRVVFVTVDPDRDRAPVVERYVKSFDADFVGLTGTRTELARVWTAYGVTVDPATKEIGHGDAIYAIDANEKVVLVYPPDTRAADLAKDARTFV
jgi:protein SCO1/2